MTNCLTCGSEIEWLDDLAVDLDSNVVQAGDKQGKLTARQAELLWLLRRRAPRTLDRETIMASYDPEFELSLKLIDVQICHIRKAIEGMPFKIETVRDRGYRLVRA